MKPPEIEALPSVRQATDVLVGLEDMGLVEPAIAGGWTRAMLTDTNSSDIDVSYVGPVHYEDAQGCLLATLRQLGLDPTSWDIRGIWNAQMAYGFKHTVDNFLFYYVSSVDSAYLASNGRLHDPTGFGFDDALAGILRINEHDRHNGRKPTAFEEANVCLEGCRRIAKLGWKPTDASRQRISEGVGSWATLTDQEKAYCARKLASKYRVEEREGAQATYRNFGWGFVFDRL